ncbi:membrane protein [Aquamicrobium defluvii]|uniref:Membrane protein n=1 Tax=Aquamicrobium defluvii TaxID=69279 RepID=A0A011TYA2_9HYPH|nr:membrane protein [Aquamicrobium defluvii]EXL09137.1 membrane protein [Aquamicrobium defluvii]EZQ17328.1 membrane protein [Halopseudomonas bauzanensis]
MTNVPTGAGDRYYVYRPLLDLIGLSEGTDKARGYNETLAYGAYTGGPVDLVKMTLKQVDDLQGKMLAHPKNKWNSSAVGRYQIVRTTRRNIQKALSIPSSALFDRDMQDRMGCYLLGQRGIDKWLAGRLKLESLLDNLAREWASLPTSKGKGYYSGQNASVSVMQVTAALSEVKRRHTEGQPKIEVPVPVEVERPVVPDTVETEVKKETGLWGWLTTGFGGVGAAIAWLRDSEISDIAAFGGVAVVGLLILTFLGPRLAASIRKIREELA